MAPINYSRPIPTTTTVSDPIPHLSTTSDVSTAPRSSHSDGLYCAWYTDDPPSSSYRQAETAVGAGWIIPAQGNRRETVICDNHVTIEAGSRFDQLSEALTRAQAIPDEDEEVGSMIQRLKGTIEQYKEDLTLDGLIDKQTDIKLGQLISFTVDVGKREIWQEVRSCLESARAVICARGINSGVTCFSYWDDPVTEF